ncbi:MAG: hypothetical protein JWO65_1942 [Sphingomonas bacterium]|nr:hypothetical protein [Sphingomonas bacterium]
MTWDEAVAYALTLPGAVLSTSYNQPAMKANGNAFLNVGHEPDTSFVLQFDVGLIEMLMETHPDTFWKTPHYEGYPAVLVRYDSTDDDLVREMIARACERALAKKPPRPRPRPRK